MWNNLKTTILLAAMTGLLLAIGQLWGGQRGLMFALVLAAVMNLGSYFFSDKIALKMSGAKPISRQENPRLYQIVERLAAKANIPVPKIYYIPTDSPNAFATGRNPSHASVAVTGGILDICDDEEIEGVLAHELGHVKNRDILISAVVATIAGAITMIARMVYWGEMFGASAAGAVTTGAGRHVLGAGHDDSRAPRGHADSACYFPLARVPGGRYRRSDHRQSPRLGAGARQDRQVVEAHPHEGLALHVAHVHLPTAHCGEVFSSLFSTHPPIRKRIERLIGQDFV